MFMYDKRQNWEVYTDSYYALKSIIVLFYDYLTCYIKKSIKLDVKILIIIGIQAKECYDNDIIWFKSTKFNNSWNCMHHPKGYKY